MKTNVYYQPELGYPPIKHTDADSVDCTDGIVRIYRKNKCVAVYKAMRRGRESLGWAWVEREKTKWRLVRELVTIK